MNINQLTKQELIAIIKARAPDDTQTQDWGKQAPEYYDELQELKEAYAEMEMSITLYATQRAIYRDAIVAHQTHIMNNKHIHAEDIDPTDTKLWSTLDA